MWEPIWIIVITIINITVYKSINIRDKEAHNKTPICTFAYNIEGSY